MKKLIILIAIIPTLIFGQTVIENETFRIMNEYRISKGLKAIPYSSKISKAAEHQCRYMVLSGAVGHFQDIDLPRFQEIKDPAERFHKIVGNKSIGSWISEICTSNPMAVCCPKGITINIGGSNNGSLSKYTISGDSTIDVPIISIDAFRSSNPHNEAMLTPDQDGLKAGISVIYDQIKKRHYTAIVFGKE
jgi:hypothetical protein